MIELSPEVRIGHQALKRLALAAIAEAADIMDATDPDDRSISQIALTDEVKRWIDEANAGDDAKRALLYEAVPSWRP